MPMEDVLGQGAALLYVKWREHLQQKNTITKAQCSEWKQKIHLFGSYLSAVVQHENCSAHLVTYMVLYLCAFLTT